MKQMMIIGTKAPIFLNGFTNSTPTRNTQASQTQPNIPATSVRPSANREKTLVYMSDWSITTRAFGNTGAAGRAGETLSPVDAGVAICKWMQC